MEHFKTNLNYFIKLINHFDSLKDNIESQNKLVEFIRDYKEIVLDQYLNLMYLISLSRHDFYDAKNKTNYLLNDCLYCFNILTIIIIYKK